MIRLGIAVEGMVDWNDIGIVWYSIFEIVGSVSKEVDVSYSFVWGRGITVHIFDKVSNGRNVLFS